MLETKAHDGRSIRKKLQRRITAFTNATWVALFAWSVLINATAVELFEELTPYGGVPGGLLGVIAGWLLMFGMPTVVAYRLHAWFERAVIAEWLCRNERHEHC
ncbi:MAG: hypothetical protein AAF297_05680 [Planctomycetota bacterium]